MRSSVLRLRANLLTLDHTKCHNRKIRHFSQNTNSAPPHNPNNEDKKKQYLRKIPPWMKRNTNNSKETVHENVKPSEKKKEIKNDKTIRKTPDQTDKYKKYFIKIKDSIEPKTLKENGDQTIKNESATSILMKKEKPSDIKEVSTANKVQLKGNKLQALGTSLKAFKRDVDKPVQELSTSRGNFHSKISENSSNSDQKQRENNATKTLTFDCIGDTKNEADKSNKSKKNQSIANTELKIVTKNETSKSNKTKPAKVIMGELMKKQDISWAKEKIDELKKIGSGPIFLNKADLVSLKQKTEAPDSESISKLNLSVVTDDKTLQPPGVESIKTEKSTAKPTRPAVKTYEEMKEQVVLKLTSNPMKLNSKETLYGNLKNNKYKEKNIKLKKDTTRLRKDTNFRNRILTMSQQPNLIRNQGNTRNRNVKAELLNQNLTNKKQLLRDVSVRKQVLSKSKGNHNMKLTQISQTKQVNLNSNTTPFKRATNINARPDERYRNKPMDSPHKVELLSLTRTIGASGQGANVQQQPWYKQIKQTISKPAAKTTQTKPNISKKPVFKANKPITVGYPPHKKNILKTQPNTFMKKPKPVFGRPTGKGGCNDDCNDGDRPPPPPIPVCVLNSDTCTSDDVEKQRTADEAAAKRPDKEEESYQLSKCSPDDGLAQLLRFFGTCKCLLIYYFKRLVNLNFYLGPKLTDPKDNLNVSILVTNNQKQPIYINDSCPYVKKSPTVYQKLQKRIDNFSHIIKNNEKANLQNQLSNKAAKSSDDNGVIMSSYPKKSYSEILTNLLSAHTQRTHKM